MHSVSRTAGAGGAAGFDLTAKKLIAAVFFCCSKYQFAPNRGVSKDRDVYTIIFISSSVL